MATYAVLGATGNTGQALLQILLQSPEKKIHAYCRSKSKLLRVMPELENNPNVEIFDGGLQDSELLANCMRGCRAAFLVVAASENNPGCTIAQDSAHAIMPALEKLRTESATTKTELPKLVVLSSMSTSEAFSKRMTSTMKAIVGRAFSYIYADLAVAEKYLRTHEEWLSMSFIKPGGLSQDVQKGHRVTLEADEAMQGFISWSDLAAGMVEVADAADDRYDMREVGVVPTAGPAGFPSYVPGVLSRGLLFHFFPWLYPYLKSWLG